MRRSAWRYVGTHRFGALTDASRFAQVEGG